MRGGEGRLTASRDAPVGGQAVLEGVMMRGITTWAVAVRKPAVEEGSTELGPIAVQSFPLVSWTKRHRFYRLPVIRGVVALAFAIGLFFVVPVGLTSLIRDQLNSSILFWLVEGVVRTSIFLGYLWLLSRLPDLRR